MRQKKANPEKKIIHGKPGGYINWMAQKYTKWTGLSGCKLLRIMEERNQWYVLSAVGTKKTRLETVSAHPTMCRY